MTHCDVLHQVKLNQCCLSVFWCKVFYPWPVRMLMNHKYANYIHGGENKVFVLLVFAI